ncbi:sulfotransferase [Winogradskyella forsetii]|uniref:sulfotransferase n=1 Tax=Winogradskyella forsetii TaxID=2686077 RepID=UPI0015C08DFD|nr:sulfotransferase [Winogradskyella forsetii]
MKIVIIALPKSGTSTLATMLRVLGYSVTGPNPNIKDEDNLKKTYNAYQAFQDYPWCFEYANLIVNNKAKVIVLKRNKTNWLKSFRESYAGKGKNYLSYKYMKVSKNESDEKFYNYYANYYKEALTFLEDNNIEYLDISLEHLNWKNLCGFLGKSVPKNIFGFASKVPKVNSKNFKNNGLSFKLKKQLKKQLHHILGPYYFKLTSFIYKNQ